MSNVGPKKGSAMSISMIASSIGESATLKLNATAAKLRAEGESVIHLGGGEPKTKAPEDALVAASKLLDTGEIRYTPVSGIPALKQAVVKYTEEFYHHTMEPKNVMVSSGAKQAIMTCFHAILDPQDEVIFPTPYWVSYPEMVKLCGAVPVPVTPEDDIYQPKLQDIEKAVTSKTKAVLINSPNNPSGAMYSEEFIAGIVEFCEKRNIYLIMDDIYHRLIFDGKQPISCYDHAKVLGEDSKIVVINGVSKLYAMTGFRIGWAVASKELIGVMANIQGHETSCPSAISQHAAVGAINGEQSSVDSLRLILEKNRDIMMDSLNSFEGVKCRKPEGTFYCFADFSAYEKDSTKLATMLVDKVRVVTVPGIEFGMEGFLRLSTCGSADDITEGIKRMKWALDPNSPKEIVIGDKKLVRE